MVSGDGAGFLLSKFSIKTGRVALGHEAAIGAAAARGHGCSIRSGGSVRVDVVGGGNSLGGGGGGHSEAGGGDRDRSENTDPALVVDAAEAAHALRPRQSGARASHAGK